MVDQTTGFANMSEYTSWLKGFSSNFQQVARALHVGVINITNNVAELVEQILPVALPVLGIALAVFFGVKFIKKVMR